MSALVSSRSASGVPLSRQWESDSTVPGSSGPSTTTFGSPASSSRGTKTAPSATRGRPRAASVVAAMSGRTIARAQGCDTARVDFIVDNAVWLSALVMLALILVGLVVLAVSGLRLWRVVKATQKRIAAGAEALSAEADRLS